MQLQTDVHLLTGTTLGPYLLGDLLDYTANGPFFMAHHTSTNAPCLVQVLALPASGTSEQRTAWLAGFAERVAPLAALQHPYILPVVDAGQARGMPYLVFPAISTRTLQSRLTQSGPLDVMTAGRYLDQIAGAMEYAHEHAILHGALSSDSIFLQNNGQLAVADFGVQQLRTLDQPAHQNTFIEHNAGIVAPEQLRGSPLQEASDVYALGAVVFQLLTGYPVFNAPSASELAQLTLHASVPSIQHWRGDLPSDLDALLAQALAKDPEQRFRRPGVFANAYHQIVAPLNAARIPFADATVTPPGAPKHSATRKRPELAYSVDQVPTAGRADIGMAPPPPLLGQLGIPYPPPRRRPDVGRMLAAFLLIALILVSGGFLVQNHFAAPKASGSVHFFDQNHMHLAALHITIAGLDQPAHENHFQAWLIDDQNEQITDLGTLRSQGQHYVLDYAETGQQPAANLLNTGNVVEITQEQRPTLAPTTKPVLTGMFPRAAFVHIEHLLVSFPVTPAKIGLLTGMVDQTSLLHSTALRLQTAATAKQSVAAQCLAISMLDILEGSHGSHAQALPSSCAANGVTQTGDGYGLLGKEPLSYVNQTGTDPGGYLVGAEDHATLAATQPDATSVLRTQAHLVAKTIDDMVTVAQRLDSALVPLAANATAPTNGDAILALANQLYGGSPTLADTVATIPGTAKGGALLAYAEGLTLADLPLSA